MDKISVFIPIYRESEFLGDLLESLTKDPYKKKEIFVIIDKPTKKSLVLKEKYKNKAKFILNGKRKGKVNALNEAVKFSKGDIFLFLDSDIKIPENCGKFLEKIVKEIKNFDIVEIKKRIIKSSLLSRAVSYDYINFNFTNWMLSKMIGKCLGINGAAFAIKRDVFYELGCFKKVVSEDLDIGTESFLKNKRFKYVRSVEVLNAPPSSWKNWFKQRKRWGIGAALWLKQYYKILIKKLRKYPQILLPSIFILPSLTLFFFTFFFSTTSVEKFIALSLMFISAKISFLIPFLSLTSISAVLIKNIIASLICFTSFSIFFYYISRKLDYEFNLFEFGFYFFFYCPVWFLIMIVSLIKVFIFSSYKVDDWKV
jgi:cellulose synthase/poly-beta-1,6-N-acetylglucosamine synthase-like glycosyltransferase